MSEPTIEPVAPETPEVPVEPPPALPPAEPPPAVEKPPPADPATPAREARRQARAESRFAELARRESEMVERERALRAEAAEHKDRADRAAAWFESLRADPVGALAQAGITYDQISQQVLQSGRPAPSPEDIERAAMRQRVENAEKRLEQMAQAQASTQAEALQRVYLADLADAARASTDAAIKAWDPDEVAEAAIELSARHYARTQQVLDNADAIGMVGKKLRAMAEALKRIPGGTGDEGAAGGTRSESRTLGAGMTPRSGTRPLTDEEKDALAIQILERGMQKK